MKAPHANHYVSQFYLKGFADPLRSDSAKKPVIWVYERGCTPRLSTPEHEAYENDFYAFEDVSGNRYSLENLIAPIESRVAPIFRRLEDLDHVVSDSERYHMAVFTSLMFVRGPRGRELVSRSLGAAMKECLRERARDTDQFRAAYEKGQARPDRPSADEMREYILEGNFEIIQEGAGLNLRTMMEAWDRLSPILFAMQWQILHAEGGQLFFTSDGPVISLLPQENGRAGFGAGFRRPNVEVYFPLSSRVCLRLGEACIESTATISNSGVRQINKGVAICAKRFLYAPERSTKVAAMFDKVGGKVSYGVNAFVHPSAVKDNVGDCAVPSTRHESAEQAPAIEGRYS